SPAGGVGGEIIASLVEHSPVPLRAKRIAALPVPIPSVKSLEGEVLPSAERIIKELIAWK
ncbi:MAG: hypothetical protein AAGM67_06635, partial [Bacteroidota bacterium]